MDYSQIGKTLAPVEIDGKGAMEVFGITYRDLVPFVVGTTSILIYPVPVPPEVCEELLRDLRRKYSKQARKDRCMIRGAYGKLRICPEKYSCAECPFGQEDKLSRCVSLEAVQEDGVDVEDPFSDCLPELNVTLFLDYLKSIHPQYREIILLKLDGYSITEISERLQVPYHLVWYAFTKIRGLAAEYFGQ